MGFCEIFDTTDRVLRSQGLCQEEKLVILVYFCYINQINSLGQYIVRVMPKEVIALMNN